MNIDGGGAIGNVLKGSLFKVKKFDGTIQYTCSFCSQNVWIKILKETLII